MYNLYQQVNEIFNPGNARAVIRNIEQRQIIDLKPEDVEVIEEGEDEIQMAHFTDDDYPAIECRIKKDNHGEGCTGFKDRHDGEGFSATITGTIYRTITRTGDGHITPFDKSEDIEITIESCTCYNAAGAVIPSDFDRSKIK